MRKTQQQLQSQPTQSQPQFLQAEVTVQLHLQSTTQNTNYTIEENRSSERDVARYLNNIQPVSRIRFREVRSLENIFSHNLGYWQQRPSQRPRAEYRQRIDYDNMPIVDLTDIEEDRPIQEKRARLSALLAYDRTCAICYEDMVQISDVYLTACSHIFHDECLSAWLNKDRPSPLCKRPIF